MTKNVFDLPDEDDLGIFDIVGPRDWEDTPTVGTTLRALDYEIATLDRYRFDWSKIVIVGSNYPKYIPQVIDLDEDDDECI